MRSARRIVTLVLAIVLLAAGCLGVGGPVPGEPAHHRARGFANMNPAYERPGFWTRWSFFASRVWSTTVGPRPASFSLEAVDAGALRANHGAPTVTWVGHSTLLVQLEGVTFLTDPQWTVRRTAPPTHGRSAAARTRRGQHLGLEARRDAPLVAGC